jgi:hypothetical protein
LQGVKSAHLQGSPRRFHYALVSKDGYTLYPYNKNEQDSLFTFILSKKLTWILPTASQHKRITYNIPYLLTPCSRVLLEKLTGSAASQEIPRVVWNPKVQYRTHKFCFVSRGSISSCEYYLTFVFDGAALSAPRPTPKLEDHPLSVVRDCLFNIFAATLHIGDRSSIRNLRTRHAVVTGTHLAH